MAKKYDYEKIISDRLLQDDGILEIEEIFKEFPEASQATIRGKTKEIISNTPEFWGRVAGVFPDTDAILNKVEQDLGRKIAGQDLVIANQRAKEIVDSLRNNFTKHFCATSLGDYFDEKTGSVFISINDLHEVLLSPFEQYLTRIGNGLVSIAGTLNQSLLVRALRTGGLIDHGANPTFKETGTKSEGDVHVYFYGEGKRAANKTLSIEAKSYAARERLLRGLTDIKEPKVGVGFFNDSSEFNEGRVTLLATSAHASAIYMPRATLDRLTPEAKAVSHPATGAICRSLEDSFVTDMIKFSESGTLPKG